MQEALQQVPEHTRVFVRKYTDIIDRIYDLMEERGFLQKDLANMLDKRESEISKWLKGDHNLTLRTIAKLEVALGGEIIFVPQKKENVQFSGWKKTSKQNMHVHRSESSIDAAFQPGKIKNFSSQEHKAVAI
jgi:transcriptional regulator with XRE-family HTH domain